MLRLWWTEVRLRDHPQGMGLPHQPCALQKEWLAAVLRSPNIELVACNPLHGRRYVAIGIKRHQKIPVGCKFGASQFWRCQYRRKTKLPPAKVQSYLTHPFCHYLFNLKKADLGPISLCLPRQWTGTMAVPLLLTPTFGGGGGGAFGRFLAKHS